MRPKKPVRMATRPLPTAVTMGHYLRPSVFTRAMRLEKAEEDEESMIASIEDDDNEDWVRDFEVKYGDVMRVAPKEKHQKGMAGKKTADKKGTPAKIEACQLAPLEVVYPEGAELRAAEAEAKKAPRYTKMKVALDSGAGAHVINPNDAPGYAVQPSAMSKAGAAFLAADGGRIPNYGEVKINLIAHDSKGGSHKVTSRFEAADVTRALWSVGLICDSGLDVRFSSERAVVADKKGQEICVFSRINGLYVAEVDVENPNPEGFHRRGQ